MRYLIAIFFLIFLQDVSKAQKIKIKDPIHYLALGDSYTIGQSVDILQRWSNQLADKLTHLGYNVAKVEFIAQTDWCTDNLINAVEEQQPLTGFNLVYNANVQIIQTSRISANSVTTIGLNGKAAGLYIVLVRVKVKFFSKLNLSWFRDQTSAI